MLQANIRLPPKWIELNFNKTECDTFLAVPNDPSMCQCGRKKIDHAEFIKHQHRPETWSPRIHTKTFNTDAYGGVIFEGEHHPNKAHYVRLSYDTNPELIIQLMTYVWSLDMPQLLISVRGGSTNFDMSPRMGKIFQTGLIKAARNTNAWIFSNGLNSGVAKHLGNALSNEKRSGGMRKRVIAVGIACWGMVENREELIGRNKERTYNPLDNNSKFFHLNPRHSNFLLVDNGTIGKFGGENYLRRRLEKCISSYPINPNRTCNTPVVVIVLAGGFYTLRQISDYLYDEPPIPVVVFAGTGLSADLISFVIRKVNSEEEFNNEMKEKIYHRIMQSFHVNSRQCAVLYKELRNIYRKRSLVTVYNPNSTNEEDFDAVILSSIFRSQHWSPLQQLSLTLVWNRVDIAQTEVFIYGRDWSRDHLEHAMMQALVSNRLEFVDLLLEHGINMQTFLTATRLEALYSLETIPSPVLRSLLVDLSQNHSSKSRVKTPNKKHGAKRDLTLHDIGMALSHMIGHVYQSSYIHIVAKIHTTQAGAADEYEIRAQTFLQPFDDLFVWAVITYRHEMSKLFWRHGKGALAKALIAIKLNRYIAEEINAAEKTSKSNLAADFDSYAEEWENLSASLLDSCYRANSKMARQLLTMELENWSKQTCMTLAFMAGHRTFLGHSCCQILLADLWMGAFKIKSNSTLKIILGILFFPFVFCLEYKSSDELQLLPHQDKTGHSTGEGNQDTYADNQLIENTGDPESPVKSRPELEKEYRSTNERTTDLAIVAKSIFPLAVDPNAPQVNTINESGQGIPSDQRPNSKKVAEGAPDDQFNFRFKLRSMQQTETSRAPPKTFDRSNFVSTQQSLGPWRQFVEFQSAPITNYIRHTMGYLIFIVAFVYVILFRQDPKFPGWVEWYVIAYFVTQFMECLREFVLIDAIGVSEKLAEVQRNTWQFGDLIFVISCLVAVALRLTGYFDYGMLIFRISSIYWNVKLYKYLSIHRYLGPKISMMRRMLKHMVHFSLIIVVIVITFGIFTKAIRFPETDPTLQEMAESFLEPYKMMFGEVEDLEGFSRHCDADTEDKSKCTPGYWIVPIAWILYMMVSNILMVNVLIAVFNGIYEEVDAIAIEVWMFQRFDSVMEFERKPLLPPPFIIISHIISVMKCLYGNFVSCLCEDELLLDSQLDDDINPRILMGNDNGLKSFLTPEEESMAFDFEEEHVDNLSPMLERESPSGGGMGGAPTSLNSNPVSDATAESHRHGTGGDKFAVQQMKLVIGELTSELESQKAKLDKLINYWELDIASGNPDTINAAEESPNKGNYCNFCEGDGENGFLCSDERYISTTSSIDAFS